MKKSLDFYSIFNNKDNFLVELLKLSNDFFDDSISFIDAFLQKLEDDSEFLDIFCNHLSDIFKNMTFRKFLLDTGILEEHSLFSVFFRRFTYSILPQIEDDKTLISLTNTIFYQAKNYHQLKIIPKDRWEKLFEIILSRKPELISVSDFKVQLVDSISILIDRISGTINEPEMLRLSKSLGNPNRPVKLLAQTLRKSLDKSNVLLDTLEIKTLISANQLFLDDILNQKELLGISLRVTVVITKLRQQLQRLQILVNSLSDLQTKKTPEFLAKTTKTWLDFYSPKNKLVKQFSTTIYLLTFIATNHNGITGEKYITSSAKEYLKMLLSACGGGLIVAVLCFIKLHLSSNQEASPLHHAIGYSLNYAIGFVVIYLLHFTLATKQPAMTAATISHAILSGKENEISYKEFSQLFARLFRSQFIAFIGNVGMCIPISLLIFWIFHNILGFEIVPQNKASKMLEELTKPDFTIFWYGSIAGIFLFLSGLISGLAINHTRYNNILNRIYNHPVLVKMFSSKSRTKIINWYERNIGGITSNIVLGFLLGCAFLLGKFTGIPFDIRHITFAAGNFGIAISGLGFNISINEMLIAIISVFGIGGFNFIVSFYLSLIIALRSNKIPMINLIKLLYRTFIYFIKNPLPFFFPKLKA